MGMPKIMNIIQLFQKRLFWRWGNEMFLHCIFKFLGKSVIECLIFNNIYLGKCYSDFKR